MSSWIPGVAVTAMALWLAGCGVALAQELTQAEVSVDDVSMQWQAKRGLTISYKGVDGFIPYASELTVHDAKWTKALFSSAKEPASASLQEAEGGKTLIIESASDCFSYTKRVALHPGNKLVVEYEFGQTGLDDAALQLGWRPAVPWLDGAMYAVTFQGKNEEGRMTYGRGERRVLWSGLREMAFQSIFGVWRMKTSHDMTLYDDRDKGTFFLGWDQPLEEGKRYSEVVEVSFEPAGEAAPGLKLSDFDWTRETQRGFAWVRCNLARTEDGPRELKLQLEVLSGDKAIASRQVEIALTGAPTPVELSLPLGEPGSYALRLTALDTASGEEILRVQGLSVTAKALLGFMPSLSLYTDEKEAELILRLAEDLAPEGLSARLSGDTIGQRTIALKQRETVVPIELEELADGRHEVTCVLLDGEQQLARATAQFCKAPPKPNEVKIDYRSRGLIVDGKPYFPFGFYTHRGTFYDQDDPEYVLRLEGAFKFNMICVYHNFSDEFRKEKRPVTGEFLDEADAVGMRMHYDVRSMTDREATEEVAALLAEEVEAHWDAPALLCWYLSDEPAGRRIAPDRYIAHNAHMKELDPYHPTTMVFCVPSKAHEYKDGMDILMVDPYPIPNRPVTNVADTVDLVLEATGGSMPIWCVPQAFGGGEGWGREPTWQEQRCMTYLAIVHGATGIQYFIRRAPHNNPFVDGMWAECRKLAAEIKELTPVLLSHEAAPEVVATDGDPALHLTARQYDGAVYLLCVNTEKQPKSISIECGVAPTEADAEVLFEDRTVPVSQEGEIRDMIDGLGVRIYSYRVGPPKPNQVQLAEGNLLRNGGFENATNPGFPDHFRVGQGKHRGGSWGTDPLEAIEGRHSLFIRCPTDGEGPTVTCYPMRLKEGKYSVALYVKAGTEGQTVRLHVSGFKDGPSRDADVGTQWQREEMEFAVPAETRWVHFSVRPEKRGIIWADAVEVREVE